MITDDPVLFGLVILVGVILGALVLYLIFVPPKVNIDDDDISP